MRFSCNAFFLSVGTDGDWLISVLEDFMGGPSAYLTGLTTYSFSFIIYFIIHILKR